MGSCSSVDKDTDSTIRNRLGINYKGRGFFIPSAAKEKPLNGKKPGAGNNEEIFFDSQAWLDSDCEDDFFSVNGEFTPSQGSTPNHQISASSTPRLGNSFFVDKYPDSSSEPSPTGRKKLGDLFRETSQVKEVANVPNAAEIEVNKKLDLHKTNKDQQPSRSLNGTPSRSGFSSFCSSGVTPTRDPRNRKEKIWKAHDCCLPSGPLALMRECRR